MNVISLIESDVSRVKPKKMQSFLFWLGLAFIPAGFGILMREDLVGVLDLRVLGPNLLAALVVSVAAWLVGMKNLLPKKLFGVTLVIALFGLLFAVDRMMFPVDVRTTYATLADFWLGNGKCFGKGLVTSLVFSMWVGGFAFLLTSLPNRRRRVMICLVSGIAGTVMLGFHCDSSSVGHVLVSHVGQGVIAGYLAFLLLEAGFQNTIRSKVPRVIRGIKNPHKLG